MKSDQEKLNSITKDPKKKPATTSNNQQQGKFLKKYKYTKINIFKMYESYSIEAIVSYEQCLQKDHELH
jgi:hypothetical protein